MTPALVALIHVTDVQRITPRMVRITFTGDGLDALAPWPDQQLKLCFPRPGQSAPRLPDEGAEGDAMRWYQAFLAIPEDERPWMRSYTVRSHDPARQEIAVDFVLHEGADGPATRWAASAAVGDTLARYGPDAAYAGQLPLDTADWLLLAGDDTALPAIGSLIETLPEGARALACIEVADAAEEQPLAVGRAGVTVRWIHRKDAPGGPGEALLHAVRDADIPSGEGEVFAWLAGEAGTVRMLRRHLVGERGLDKRQAHFTGYWRRSLTQDDAPTEEDLAEAQERIAALRAESGAGWGG
ncbi:siderophore-interacting protein [Streptomyces pinistramenti]|uniref:siderophore-interacting protein n=1 Tax=Streptomyces pinistramenti TaxID=2884812 RepID=UPI001D07017C|nr:siderophore-interacting protein [Streptomyces pinistramenti]MCB5907819.1 siderophore-interacting protein [Streptomyces pinistramenti]